MENNQAQQEYKSLAFMAEEELRERHNFFGASPDKFAGMTEEERDKTIKEEYLKTKILTGIESYFSMMMGKATNLKLLIGLPERMINSHSFGSDYATKILLGMIELNGDIVNDYRRELDAIACFNIAPSNAVKKFLQHNFIGDDTTYAEAVWLLSFCKWLGCSTSTFYTEVSDLAKRAQEDKNFKFTNTIGDDPKYRPNIPGVLVKHVDDDRNAGLRFAFSEQYQILENLLNRLA